MSQSPVKTWSSYTLLLPLLAAAAAATATATAVPAAARLGCLIANVTVASGKDQ